jgi:hypothetical protein
LGGGRGPLRPAGPERAGPGARHASGVPGVYRSSQAVRKP